MAGLSRPARSTRPPRLRGWVLVLLLVLVNIPLGHGLYEDFRLKRDGVQTRAEVLSAEDVTPGGDPTYVVRFRLADFLDPDQAMWVARVDRAAYERARSAGTIPVRVVPGSPALQEVPGEQGSRLALVLAVAGNVVVLLLLAGWLGSRRRAAEAGPLRVVALEDVHVAPRGSGIERLDDTTFLVTGEVLAREPDAVVLDLGDRTVHVDLDGHVNPVGHQQPARVRARLPESPA